MQCSSSTAAGTLLDKVANRIDEGNFKALVFDSIQEKHKIGRHSLSNFVEKSEKLPILNISGLSETTEENRIELLDMAENVIRFSESLKTLILAETNTSGVHGQYLVESLADSYNNTLETINFSQNEQWFAGSDDTIIQMLCHIIERQAALRKLDLSLCKLSDSQKSAIQECVSSNTECDFEDDEENDETDQATLKRRKTIRAEDEDEESK